MDAVYNSRKRMFVARTCETLGSPYDCIPQIEKTPITLLYTLFDIVCHYCTAADSLFSTVFPTSCFSSYRVLAEIFV